VTLNPGVYIGGISISGQANVILNPGIYYMQGGGFSLSGQGNLSGNGVMIYNDPINASDKVSLTGQGSVTLSPPTTGTYAGMVIYQDHSTTNSADTAPIALTGQGNMTVTGTIYAARAALNATGQGGVNIMGSQFIGDTMSVTGQGSIYIQWSPNQVAMQHNINYVR
jgi:hypothetical protein